MPHVRIDCFEGRTYEQKKECANKVAEVIAATLGCETSSVSVAISDVAQADWKKDVWDAKIIPDKEILYKEPEYSYD